MRQPRRGYSGLSGETIYGSIEARVRGRVFKDDVSGDAMRVTREQRNLVVGSRPRRRRWSEETGRGERQSEGKTRAMKVRKHDGRFCKRIKIEEGREGKKKKRKRKRTSKWSGPGKSSQKNGKCSGIDEELN